VPNASALSAATRSATETALILRGCVQIMLQLDPLKLGGND